MQRILLKKKLYDRYAEFYEKRTKTFADKFIDYDINLFLKKLPGKKILDLGSGPGRDSLIFQKRGFKPLCLDISKEMLKLCRSKGLKAKQMDINKLKFPSNYFAGIWSYTSLTTMTKKEVWCAIKKIHQILKNDGIFFLGLIEGRGEGWKAPDNKYNLPRFRSRYQTKEVLRNISNFELLYFRKIEKGETGRNTYLNFMFKKL